MRSALPPACSISRCARSSSALLRASRADAIAGGRKADRQTLADAAARARDQHTGIGQSLQRRESFLNQGEAFQFNLVQNAFCCWLPVTNG